MVVLGTVCIFATLVIWRIARTTRSASPVASRASGSAPGNAPALALPPQIDGRPGFARVQLEGIVIEFITWSSREAGATCSTPRTFSVTGEDPWGTQVALLCSQSAGQLQIVVTSAGPDRVFGTEDDLDARSLGRR